jgi:hypothetical protein
VRQAYARQLKQIDQATEIAAFQALHDALASPEPRRPTDDSDGQFSNWRIVWPVLWLAFMAWRHFH